MSYLALYRKYRPNSFNAVMGQNFVIKVLKNSIINGKVSHAYLFSGPRGTGKTTTAKLIAKLINCENRNMDDACNCCNSCIAINNKNNPDIIEMDAASNNGVDEIREIRDKIGLMPTISKYKIYIIDEVHMLSTGAFNALLKTLEEPPQHVIFILATTEFYKVPETIVSRCQCFNFERISNDDIINELRYIANEEKMDVDDEVFSLIAKYSDGGLRDAINMLDKLYCCTSKITVDDFYSLKGLASRDDFNKIIECIFAGKVKDTLDVVDGVIAKGKNITLLAEELLEYIKNVLVNKSIDNISDSDFFIFYQVIDIINDTIEKMRASFNPKIMFEVGLLKCVNLFVSGNKIISREIIFENKCDTNTEKVVNDVKISQNEFVGVNSNKVIDTNAGVFDSVNSNDCVQCSDASNDKISVDNILSDDDVNEKKIVCDKLVEENRKIRINNAFATANKDILEELKIKLVNLSDYLHNREFSSVVSYLLDGSLRVAGEKYLIVSVKYASILENAIKNLDKIELLFNLVSGRLYKIAFVLDDEWNELKKKYISDRNNGIHYELIDEKVVSGDIIIDNSDDEVSEVIGDAISLFGKNLIEVK